MKGEDGKASPLSTKQIKPKKNLQLNRLAILDTLEANNALETKSQICGALISNLP